MIKNIILFVFLLNLMCFVNISKVHAFKNEHSDMSYLQMASKDAYKNHYARRNNGYRNKKQKRYKDYKNRSYKKQRRRHYKFRSPIISTRTMFIPFTVEVKDIGIKQKDNIDMLQITSFEDFFNALETQYNSCETEIVNLKEEYAALDKFHYQTLGKCNKDKNLRLISALYKANLTKDFDKSEHKLLIESILDKNILNAQKYDNKSITKEEYETSWTVHTSELQNLTRKIFAAKK